MIRLPRGIEEVAQHGNRPDKGLDAAWQANHRNLKLVERHYVPGRRPRSVRGLLIAFAVVVVLFLAALAALTVAVVSLVWRLVSAL